MEYKNEESRNLKKIVREYEVMSAKGTVAMIKEPVFFKIIEYYRESISVLDALKAVDHALVQYPSTSDFYFIKASLLLDTSEKSEAINCLERAQVFAPGDYDIKILLASLLNEQKLENNTNESISANMFTENSLFDKDHIEAKLSQIDSKIFLLQEELAHNPKNEHALAQLLQCISFTEEYKRGARIFNEIIDQDPYSSIAWFNLGFVYQEMENFALAIEAFEYAFLIDNEFIPAYESYADLNIKLGNFKKALSAFEDLLSTDIKPNASLLTQIGYCYELKGDFEFAQAFYVKAFELEPNSDNSYYRLAECLMKQGKAKQAISPYFQAIELNANNVDYYLGLSDAFLEIGNEERAINHLDTAVIVAPDEHLVWIKFISVLLLLNRNEEAMATCLEAKYNSNNDILLQYAYAVCHFRIGNNQEGMVRLVDCLSKDVSQHEIIFELAPELKDNSYIMEILAMYL